MKLDKEQTAIAKNIFWLAYQASSVIGMGRFQAQDNATEDDVWNNVTNSGDYLGKEAPFNNIYADYVFGRMMKLTVKVNNGQIEIHPSKFRPDYQSFSHKYPDPESLFVAAVEETLEV